MAIYKRGNLYWVSVYRPGKPRLRVSTGCEDPDDARAVENVLKRAHRGATARDRLHVAIDQIIGEEQSSGLPLDRAWTVYESLREVTAGPATMRVRRLSYNKFLAWRAESWPSAKVMADVSRQCAFAFIDWLRDTHLTGKSINNTRGNLSAIWQALLVRENLTENVWRLTPTASTIDSRNRRAFTLQEEKKIMQTAAGFGQWLDVCILARYTGLRKTDLLNLRWSEIIDNMILLNPRKTRRHKVMVKIPLHKNARTALARIEQNDDLVFSQIMAESGRSRNTTFKRILAETNISDSKYILDFHCWRHTFRTRLREAGIDESTCNKLGGWVDNGEGDRYDHALEPLQKAIDALE